MFVCISAATMVCLHSETGVKICLYRLCAKLYEKIGKEWVGPYT